MRDLRESRKAVNTSREKSRKTSGTRLFSPHHSLLSSPSQSTYTCTSKFQDTKRPPSLTVLSHNYTIALLFVSCLLTWPFLAFLGLRSQLILWFVLAPRASLNFFLASVVKAFFFTKNKSKFIGYTAGKSLRTFLKAQPTFVGLIKTMKRYCGLDAQGWTKGNRKGQELLTRAAYKWGFSHDVTKIQSAKLFILLRFYFLYLYEELKTINYTNFRSEWVLGFVIAMTDYARSSKLLRDVAPSWQRGELSCWLKKMTYVGEFSYLDNSCIRNSIISNDF